MVAMMLLVPVVVLTVLNNLASRLMVIVVSVGLFIGTISMTYERSFEALAAGAA
jgi:hypothetical protein